MSWIQKLQETYDRCVGQPQFESTPLIPIDHAEQQVHIEITLSGTGKFRDAVVISKETTFIPATEKSAGRTSAPVPHGLADKLQYLAASVDDTAPLREQENGGTDVTTNSPRNPNTKMAKASLHALYLNQLRRWVASEPDPRVEAVLHYVESGTILNDLLQQQVLHVDAAGRLLTQWTGIEDSPTLFKVLTATAGQCDQLAAVVRWRVELREPRGDARLWLNPRVQRSWQSFMTKQAKKSQFCMVTGEQLPPAINHPKRLRQGADRAKLVSSNDSAGFTFRGRFESAEQVYGIGSPITQKAHNALRWLIARQGYRNGDQAIVAWAVSGKPIPKVIAGSDQISHVENELRTRRSRGSGDDPLPVGAPELYRGDAGQLFAKQLNTLIRGYEATLRKREDIVVMALDSATPGRLAITYYRELSASEFLERLQSWQQFTAWPQNMGKNRRFIGAPSPADIAEAAFGRRVDEKLKKATIERLLPCIVDGRTIPRDLVTACAQEAANPAGMKHWEWERCLGIACSLVRSSQREENYSMSLEEGRNSRDYLFGRLLAIAEKIESYALFLAKEHRDTTAERLMQRFSTQPATTWRTIELALRPYMQRLQSSRPGYLYNLKCLLDDVVSRFREDDFTRPGRLDAEFLLGYHCQRAALRLGEPAAKTNTENDKENNL